MLLAMSKAVARPPVLTAVITAVLLRVVTAVATLLVVWPVLGVPVALLFGTPFFAAGVSAELLFGAILTVFGVVAGVRVRRDPVRWHRAAIKAGWVLVVDTAVYLVGVLAGSGLIGWRILPSIVAGNLVLLWLGVRVVRRGRALIPPPEEAGAP